MQEKLKTPVRFRSRSKFLMMHRAPDELKIRNADGSSTVRFQGAKPIEFINHVYDAWYQTIVDFLRGHRFAKGKEPQIWEDKDAKLDEEGATVGLPAGGSSNEPKADETTPPGPPVENGEAVTQSGEPTAETIPPESETPATVEGTPAPESAEKVLDPVPKIRTKNELIIYLINRGVQQDELKGKSVKKLIELAAEKFSVTFPDLN